MIHFINEDLFSFKFSEDSSHGFLQPYHMEVCSANELLHQKEPADGEGTSTPKTTSVQMEKFVPIVRRIMNVHSIDNDFINHPMSMRVSSSMVAVVANGQDGTEPGTVTKQRKNITVDVRCLEDGNDNRVNLYVVAFPFNGLLVPIPEDPKYRIYKGTLVSSRHSFWYKGRKYRKVVYFVIEPNLNLFDPTHKHHTDEIAFKFEAMGIYTDKHDDNRKKTNHETMCVTVTDREGNFTVTREHEVIDEAVNLDPLTAESLWHTFEFEPRERRNNDGQKPGGNYNRNQRQQGGSYQRRDSQRPPRDDRDDSGRGGTRTIVTTNKHGIRKEVTVPYKNKKPYRDNSAKTDKPGDIDSMIEKAGLISSREYKANQSFTPRRGKKGKRH